MNYTLNNSSNNILSNFDFSNIQVHGSSNSNPDFTKQHQMQDAEYVRNLFLSDPIQLSHDLNYYYFNYTSRL